MFKNTVIFVVIKAMYPTLYKYVVFLTIWICMTDIVPFMS